MFEEQFASREHDSTVPCPTRVVADAGGIAGMAIRLPAGVAQHMTRAGEYVRGLRPALRVRRRRHISFPRRPCCVRLGQPVAELPLEILMRGDGPPTRIRAACSVELTSGDQWVEVCASSLVSSSALSHENPRDMSR